jgi:hypothetical protein
MKLLKLVFLGAATVLSSVNGISQEEKESCSADCGVKSQFDLAIGVGASSYTGALMWSRNHGLFKGKKFRIGYGVRLSGFGGSNLNYSTAPAKLIADNLVDSILIGSPLNMGFNANIHLGYIITPKWQVGFNIDAVGFSFGGNKSVDYASGLNNPDFPERLNAAPTALNALLIGNNDLGMLKSEFYVAYNFCNKYGVRAGLDFTFSEYTTAQKLNFDNDRFRHKAMMGFVAFTYNPF